MSLPIPNFKLFVEIAIEKLDAYIETLDSSPSLSKKTLEQIREDLQAISKVKKVSKIKDKEIKELTGNAFRTLTQGSKCVTNFQSSSKAYYAFQDQMKVLEKCVKNPKEEDLISAHFSEKWAQNEFIELLKRDNPWAEQKLYRMLEGKDPSGFKCLILSAAFNEKLRHVFLQQLLEPRFLDVFCELTFSSRLTQEQSDALVLGWKILLDQRDLSFFSEEFIMKLLNAWRQHQNTLASSVIHESFQYFLEKNLDHPGPNVFFLQVLLKRDHNCLNAFIQFLKTSEPDFIDKHPFISFFAMQAKKESKALALFIAFPCFVQDDEIFNIFGDHLLDRYNPLDLFIDDLDDSLQNHALNARLLNCAVRLKRDLDKKAEIKDIYDETGYWETQTTTPRFDLNVLPINYQFDVICGHIERIKRLLDFFLQGEKTQQPLNPLIDEQFIKPGRVLVGAHPHAPEIAKAIGEIFKEEEIETTSVFKRFDPTKISIKRYLPHDVVEAPIGLEPWVRDYFFQMDKSYRFFPYFQLSNSIDQLVEAGRKEKTKSDGITMPKKYLGAPGYIDSNLHASYFINRLMEEGKIPKKPIEFCYTYQEGGNIIQAGDHLLVGEDHLALNRALLLLELAKLGLKKDERGWVLATPYTKVLQEETETDTSLKALLKILEMGFDDEIALSDEIVLKLMAEDLGVDPTKIVLVPQFEYHLDVAMTYSSHTQTVLMQDSMQACNFLKKHFEKDFEKNPKLKQRWTDLNFEATYRKMTEDFAEKRLKEKGIKVERIAGIFSGIEHENPENHQVNFFNHVCFKGKKREHILVPGADAHYRDLFVKMCEKHFPGTLLHFMNTRATKALLENEGALHCLMQLFPEN